MALYQFCAKRKGGNFHRVKHILGEAKHDLQILDLISMQFNTKEELMEHLGLSLEEFDDIAITYKSNGEPRKLDVILSDAPELEDILYSMTEFGHLEEYEDINIRLAIAYDNPATVQTTNEVNRESWGFKRINQTLLADPYRPEGAFNVNLLHRRAFEFYSRGQDEAFNAEITKSYLTIRKIYTYLRSRGYLKPSKEIKPNVPLNLKTIISELERVQDDSIYNKIMSILAKLNTTDYEEGLITRILNGDHDALEQLMSLDAHELEKFQELLALLPQYLEEVRKRRKTFDSD